MGVLVPVGASWPTEVEAWADEWRRTAREVVTSELVPVGQLALPDRLYQSIMRFAVPEDFEASATMAEFVHQAKLAVARHRESGLDDTVATLAAWQGDAADGFRHYLQTMRDAVHLMELLLTDQQTTLENYNKLLDAMKQDFHDTMDAAADGLDKAQMAEESAEAHICTAIANATSSFEGSPAALFTGAVTVYLDWKNVQGKPEVLESFANVLDQLHDGTTAEMDRIARAFKITEQNILDNGALLRPPRPTLVTDKRFDPDDFSSRSPGAERVEHRASHKDLVAEPKDSQDPDQESANGIHT
ncbi:hypothetical protein [Sciscionella marina]|uniref:hypothetical protein n=1 Tax=Sciscionella marina TaxID=508770 RepID=UPI0003774BB2|nr:hypothetical protein [Sciscionella marina]